ncbi:hypothetical protein ABSH91_003443 [Salmonella enterica]
MQNKKTAEIGGFFMVDNKPAWLLYAPFCQVAASPYPAYENSEYQQVIRDP